MYYYVHNNDNNIICGTWNKLYHPGHYNNNYHKVKCIIIILYISTEKVHNYRVLEYVYKTTKFHGREEAKEKEKKCPSTSYKLKL